MIDERGSIETIADGDFKCVQLIESRRGSVRSNHFHKKGGHWLYVLSGSMQYREFKVNPSDVVWVTTAKGITEYLVPPWPLKWEKEMSLGPGDKIFTGPGVFHQTEFTEDTVLISCAIGELDHESYEADTVRLGKPEYSQIWSC